MIRPVTSFSLCLAAMAVSLAGCHQVPGAASFQFVDVDHSPPATDASTLNLKAATTVFVQAKPIGSLASPVYPPAALAAHAGAATLTVKISVDKDGRVTAVGPSLADVSIPTRFYREFHQAIDAAVAHWRFEPAMLGRLEPTKEGPPLVVGLEETETSFDVAVTFSSPGTGSSICKDK